MGLPQPSADLFQAPVKQFRVHRVVHALHEHLYNEASLEFIFRVYRVIASVFI